MSLDGKLLAMARDGLEKKKRNHKAEIDRRTEQVYAKSPRVKMLDEEIRTTMLDVVRAVFSKTGNIEDTIDNLQKNNLYLQKERRQAISDAGFPKSYLDMGDMCPKCGDTGFIGTKTCDCLMELYKAEQAKSLSSLLRLGNERFEEFQLHWYDDARNPDTNISPREHMNVIYNVCRKYAVEFGDKSMNLLLTGGPGLGKTFLSACIARVVSEKAISVVYETAGTVFSAYETARFSKGAQADGAKTEIQRYLECDLFILDDLGTELTTAFTITALYELVNTRLSSGKKTVINTNLAVSEIGDRYSPQIASRLEGEYQVLPFYGQDIRILKKKRRQSR